MVLDALVAFACSIIPIGLASGAVSGNIPTSTWGARGGVNDGTVSIGWWCWYGCRLVGATSDVQDTRNANGDSNKKGADEEEVGTGTKTV